MHSRTPRGGVPPGQRSSWQLGRSARRPVAEEVRGCVFLDRDGTINQEVAYLSEVSQIDLIAGAAEAISMLRRHRFKVVVVTNQAGIARGYFSEEQLIEIHHALDVALRKQRVSAVIDAYYYCPHHPTEGRGDYRTNCDCRKPRPGMLHQAASELQLDLTRSFLVGDKLTDLQAGCAAGCRSVLVRTGYGAEIEPALAKHAPVAHYVADHLLDAANWITQQKR